MKTIVGVDEVGRGPLAGPVSVCIVSCDAEIYKKLKRNKQLPLSGKDSKKLSSIEREKYARVLKLLSRKGEISYSISHISNKTIDFRGLSFSIKKAIALSVKKLKLNPKNCEVLLDGGLKVSKEFKRQKTIIKGDEKEKIIAWASILAKVSRDGLMYMAHKKYPDYGFGIHKGYGTKMHRKSILKYGLSSFHRRSFKRIDVII